MNPQNAGYQPGPDLPKPHFEVNDAGAPEQNQDNSPKKAETAGKSAEQPLASPPPAPPAQSLPTLPAVPPPLPSTDPATPSQTGSQTVDAPSIAGDNDIIEQEWVNKAKAIVEKTKEDPHLQNKEINKFKADYIKKRYNKEVKVSED